MSSLATFKHLSTIRVAMTTCASTPLAPPFLAYNGKGGIGMAATVYIRSLGVPCSQYIDDRHCGQLRLSFTQSSYSGFALAEMAAFIACSVLISLGYFIGLKKCVVQPSTALRFLGYICDSLKQAFLLLLPAAPKRPHPRSVSPRISAKSCYIGDS